jgi:hypothetical protein
MAFKQAFSGLHRGDGTLVLTGQSDPDPPGDILDIRVILAQGERIAPATVDDLSESWNVHVPAEGFVPGPAVAFGIETRRANATTVTWAQPFDIPPP